MIKIKTIIKKSIGASILISLGSFALLKLGGIIGAFIFAIGLLGICYMNLDLFTGKCGFLFSDKLKIKDLLIMLLVNLVAGYIIGFIYSYIDNDVYINAINKVATWEFSIAFFIKSILCGIIMYIAVYMFRKNSRLGIIYGIPLFILCGFQHCIANIITLGIAKTWDMSIILCIAGNFAGSILMDYLARSDYMNEEEIIKILTDEDMYWNYPEKQVLEATQKLLNLYNQEKETSHYLQNRLDEANAKLIEEKEKNYRNKR